MATMTPLFPLHTIILPGGQLPLRIFEPRYSDMLSQCLQEDSGFVVCQIQEGREAGGTAVPFMQGTLVRIADWDQGNDNTLHVLAVGQQKVSIQHTEAQADNLLLGEIAYLPHEQSMPLKERHRTLSALLERVFTQMKWNATIAPPQFDDALWVSSRLLEVLPMTKQQRQTLFECENPLDRLDGLQRYIQEAVSSVN